MRPHQGQGQWRKHRQCWAAEMQEACTQPGIPAQALGPAYLALIGAPGGAHSHSLHHQLQDDQEQGASGRYCHDEAVSRLRSQVSEQFLPGPVPRATLASLAPPSYAHRPLFLTGLDLWSSTPKGTLTLQCSSPDCPFSTFIHHLCGPARFLTPQSTLPRLSPDPVHPAHVNARSCQGDFPSSPAHISPAFGDSTPWLSSTPTPHNTAFPSVGPWDCVDTPWLCPRSRPFLSFAPGTSHMSPAGHPGRGRGPGAEAGTAGCFCAPRSCSPTCCDGQTPSGEEKGLRGYLGWPPLPQCSGLPNPAL